MTLSSFFKTGLVQGVGAAAARGLRIPAFQGSLQGSMAQKKVWGERGRAGRGAPRSAR